MGAAGDAPSQGGRLVSAACFRVLSLQPETQNEVEVLKPILEELEVLRLSSVLGALRGMSPKDFEFDLLEAKQFDDELARFLRSDVFGQQAESSGPQVRVAGVFGKQAQVKAHLRQLGAWDSGMAARLATRDQGMYAVVLPSSAPDEPQTVVVFAWLVDEFFEPEKLRTMPTYLLRLLTCLTKEVTFCLSENDKSMIETLKQDGDGVNEEGEWKSYSIAFHVKQQLDAEDDVRPTSIQALPIPQAVEGHHRMELVKGSYPALMAIMEAPKKKIKVTEKKTFEDADEFCEWLSESFDEYDVRVQRYGMFARVKEALLRRFDRWPVDRIEEAEVSLEREIALVNERSKAEADMASVRLRDELLAVRGVVFRAETMRSSSELKRSLDVVRASLGDLKREKSLRLPRPSLMILGLPLRLERILQLCYKLHKDNHKAEVRDVLAIAPTTDADELVRRTNQSMTWQTLTNLISSLQGNWTVPEEFRADIDEPLSAMSEIWWAEVERVLDQYKVAAARSQFQAASELTRKRSKEAQVSIIESALSSLVKVWDSSSQHGLVLEVTFDFSTGSSVVCRVSKETLVDPGLQMKVWAIKEQFSFHLDDLGEVPLVDGEEIVQVFSAHTRSILIVSNINESTQIDRIELSLRGTTVHGSRSARRHTIRSLSLITTLCDYNSKDRTLLVGYADGRFILYRLNERLTSMEVLRSVNLLVTTTLELPVSDASFSDGFLRLMDPKGSVQSLNVRNLQTSRKSSPESEATTKRSRLLCIEDGTTLGWIVEDESLDRVGSARVRFFAIDDMRELPQSSSIDVPSGSSARGYSQVHDNAMFLIDSHSHTIVATKLAVTLKSESYSIGRTANDARSRSRSTEGTAASVMDHWLWALYHLYEKFPVRGELERSSSTNRQANLGITVACNSASTKDSVAFKEGCVTLLQMISSRLEELNKPLYGLDLASSVRVLVTGGGDSSPALKHAELCSQPVAMLLRELITFVPIQICRAEFNSLTLLLDGQQKPPADGSQLDALSSLSAADIAQTLRFGLLSPLLMSWSRQCIVVTSMGKQSTGKSYFLNHLTGSSFAIAGARCTDGAWMSVRLLSNGVMLVVIDFEGLGSFERTEQEDVFLSVLNASVSMLTVFRVEMRLDKEIDELFSKFQKGSQLMKGDAQLFRGKLYMSVKDVNPNDQTGVIDEFGAKFQRLLAANRDKNFLTDMYAGQLDINCSPPLGTVGYYRSLAHAQRYIERQLCGNPKAGFPSGKAFLDCVRILLAKISILDWTSLDESSMKFKVAEIAAKLPNVLRYGCHTTEIASETSGANLVCEDLVDVTTGAIIEAGFEELCGAYSSLAPAWRQLHNSIALDRLDDAAFDFGPLGASSAPEDAEAASWSIHTLFEQFVQLKDSGYSGIVITKALQKEFDVFLGYIVRRRCLRVQKWSRSAFGGRIPNAWQETEHQAFGSLQNRLVRCLDSCSFCQLGCLKVHSHAVSDDFEHDCGTTHACTDICGYCRESDLRGRPPSCAKPAGHDGRCECERGDHTCRQPCCLLSAINCAKFCAKKAGHSDGDHRCAAGLHKCGQPCAARGCTRKCVMDVQVPHQVHKCEVDRCLEPCVMDGCNRGCSSTDHFHGYSEAQVALRFEDAGHQGKSDAALDDSKPTIHMCDQAHTCPEMCAQDGICHIDVFLKQSSKTFVGARGTFQYTYQEMNGSRKRCGFKLEPGQSNHRGKHSCFGDTAAEDEERSSGASSHVRHYCDVRCPCCSYYCQKEHGHSGLHHTTHGNMRNTIFRSDLQNIDLMDRKYAAGERGTAEMCNLYCSKMGRGHVHYLDCEQKSSATCVYNGNCEDMRRHCTRTLEPAPETEQDELLHERFWDTLGWEDPCASQQEREEFAKCAFKCDAPDHDGKDASYCVLKAWHPPVVKPSAVSDGFSYVGGHQFECSHVSASNKMHHVFVLDASGSMSGAPWERLVGAFSEYVQNRIIMGATADLVSVITFDAYARIVCEAQAISTVVRARVPFKGGGTSFGAGLRAASEVLSRIVIDQYKPVLIFFSDGHPGDAAQGEQLASHIADNYTRNGLAAFVVGFGSINLPILQRVADRLGGTYKHVLTGDELKTTFHSISSSLGTHAGLALAKPSHEMICVICQKEFASDATVVLSPCHHELHQRCLRRLLESSAPGEARLCPTCRHPIDLSP